jgi:hypothetical protein
MGTCPLTETFGWGNPMRFESKVPVEVSGHSAESL